MTVRAPDLYLSEPPTFRLKRQQDNGDVVSNSCTRLGIRSAPTRTQTRCLRAGRSPAAGITQVPRDSASSSTAWRGRRVENWSICCRHETPVTRISTSDGTASTAGTSDLMAIAREMS